MPRQQTASAPTAHVVDCGGNRGSRGRLKNYENHGNHGNHGNRGNHRDHETVETIETHETRGNHRKHENRGNDTTHGNHKTMDPYAYIVLGLVCFASCLQTLFEGWAPAWIRVGVGLRSKSTKPQKAANPDKVRLCFCFSCGPVKLPGQETAPAKNPLHGGHSCAPGKKSDAQLPRYQHATRTRARRTRTAHASRKASRNCRIGARRTSWQPPRCAPRRTHRATKGRRKTKTQDK